MRQRNTSGHVVDVAAFPTDEHPDDHPFSVGPREEIDFRDLLGGFTPIQDEADAAPDSAPTKTTRKRASEPAPVPEGDEQ